jgi:CRP/FNR family transcriptional regulator, cyclic AMP receptor protein
VLAQVPLFASLSTRHRKRLADSIREARFMEGARVVKEGEVGESFFVIVEGEAKVENRSGRVVNRLFPGDFFGEISLLDGGARTATVAAETPLVTLELTRRAFRKVLEQEPAVAVKLLAYTAGLLRRLERPIAG